jgi:licheninase
MSKAHEQYRFPVSSDAELKSGVSDTDESSTSREVSRMRRARRGISAAALGLLLVVTGPADSIQESNHNDDHTAESINIPAIQASPDAFVHYNFPEITVAAEKQIYLNEKFENEASWSQNFTHMKNGEINTNYWNTFIGNPTVNNEAQYYTDSQSNVRIENGTLVIQALKEPHGNYDYTSARISTEGTQSFMYGKFEITAKLPSGIGTWPAVWLVTADNKYQNEKLPGGPTNDISYKDGEIDIAEAIGSYPNTVYGIGHALKNPDGGQYFNTTRVPDSNSAYHVYGLEWTPTELSFTIDGQPYYTVDKKPNYTYAQWPYDQHYSLIVNLALGGSWGGIDRAKFPPNGIDPSALPAELDIKSINYFPYVDNQQ